MKPSVLDNFPTSESLEHQVLDIRRNIGGGWVGELSGLSGWDCIDWAVLGPIGCKTADLINNHSLNPCVTIPPHPLLGAFPYSGQVIS